MDTQKSEETAKSAQATTLPQTLAHTTPYRPEISWKAAYSLQDVKLTRNTEGQLPPMSVGANIHSSSSVPLSRVIRGMADLKNMNVSWASDVDQNARVSVNVRADDDFWASLDNILRQLDYFYEFKNNTLIIKYKDTKRFYVTTPFITGSYQTSAGGDFLGSTDVVDNYHGLLQLDHNDAEIDLWQTIDNNLASILRLGTRQVAEVQTGPSEQDMQRIRLLCSQQFPADAAQQALCVQQQQARLELEQPQNSQTQEENSQETAQNTTDESANAENGIFYTIDKPLGIITVTAPRSLLDQVETYITNLNRELSRQVIIEAKIVEVHLDDTSSKGIDWSGLLQDHKFNFTTTFGDAGLIFTDGGFTKFVDKVHMEDDQFSVVINFLNDFGDVKILSNPKISLLNGQPGIITGGKTIRYIDRVTSNINNNGGGSVTTYNVETRDIFQGIGMGVMANIADNGEIVLQLSPVTTKLDGDIKYMQFGDAQVGLPKVYLRQITTMARVKDGQMLVIGGIISDEDGVIGNSVPLLGDIPYVGYLFKSEKKYHQKVEMVILLRPHIVEI